MGVAASVSLPASKQNSVEHENASEDTVSKESIATETSRAGNDVASTVDQSSKPISVHDIPEVEPVQSSTSTPISTNTMSASAATTPTKTNKPTARPTVPAVPVIPVLPKTNLKDAKNTSSSNENTPVLTPSTSTQTDGVSQLLAEKSTKDAVTEPTPFKPVPVQTTKAGPKLWSRLFEPPVPTTIPSTEPSNSEVIPTAADAASSDATDVPNGLSGPGSFAKSNASSLAEALRAYQVSNVHKIAFLEPRGLINTGNMCYMNSVSPAWFLYRYYQLT